MPHAMDNRFLEALMSPNASKRREAEAHFKDIPLPNRLQSLMNVLHQSLSALLTVSPSLSQHDLQSYSPTTTFLACVLLRRDISSLGSWVWLQAILEEDAGDLSGALNLCNDILSLMSYIVEFLLECFVHMGTHSGGNDDDAQRQKDIRALQRQIGQVIAEVCSCETWVYPLQQQLLLEQTKRGTAWTWTFALSSPSLTVTVLRAIGPACNVADKPSLDLLSLLAQRAPLALQENEGHTAEGSLTFSVISTLHGATQVVSEKWKHEHETLQSQKKQTFQPPLDSQGEVRHILTVANSILEAMTHVYRASDIWNKLYRERGAGENLLVFQRKSAMNKKKIASTNKINSKIFQQLMMQMVQIQTKMCDGNGNHDVMGSDDEPLAQVMTTGSLATQMGSFGVSSLWTIIHDACTADCFSKVSTANEISTILQTLSHTASICPMLLAGSIDILHHTCRALLSIATFATDHLRLGAIHTLVTLLGVHQVASMLQEYPHVLSLCINGENSIVQNNDHESQNHQSLRGVIQICAEHIVNGVDEDVDSWSQSKVGIYEDVAHSDDDDIAVFAQELLEDFLKHAGASKCLSSVFELVQTLLDMNKWQASRGALCMLEVCLVSAPYSFSRHVPVAFETALRLSSPEECVRVQVQAIQLLAELCRVDEVKGGTSTFGEQTEKLGVKNQYGDRIISTLTKAMRCCCAKVVGHACTALSAFCRGSNSTENQDDEQNALKSLILPHLSDILIAITSGPLSLDMAEHADVFTRAFDAISCLAYVVKESFAEFYQQIMPGLRECAIYGLKKDFYGNYIEVSRAEEIVLLRGGAIETASVVGQAIGGSNGLFNYDANHFMELILSMLTRHESAKDAPTLIPVDQLMTASARIASVMKDEYISFLPRILPHLLRILKEAADVTITDGDPNSIGQESEYDDDNGTKSITVAVPGMGVKKVVINSIRMQEKCQAARAIHEHASGVGLAFGPYSEECIGVFLPLLSYQYSADVRCAVAQALDPVFESACEYSSKTAHQSHISVPQKVFSPMIMGISKQLLEEEVDDVETVFALSEAMSNISYYAFIHTKTGVRSCMTCIDAKQFVSAVMQVYDKCLKRRKYMIEKVLAGKLDQDQMIDHNKFMHVQSEILTCLVDCIGYTLKTLKELFVPIFEELIFPFFSPMLKSSGSIDLKARLGAICLFDDCVEHCGQFAAAKYGRFLADSITQGISDRDLGIRESSVYGIAQLARHAPPACLETHAENLVQYLKDIAKEGVEKAKEDIEHIRLVENSVSALATMTLFKSSQFSQVSVSKTEIMQIFLANLPLKEDCDEAKFNHEGFCDLVESGQINLEESIVRIMQIIGEIADALNDGFEIATKETHGRLAGIIGALQSQVDNALLQQYFSDLTADAQNGIVMLMGQSG